MHIEDVKTARSLEDLTGLLSRMGVYLIPDEPRAPNLFVPDTTPVEMPPTFSHVMEPFTGLC